VTAEEHLAEAEKWLASACNTGGHHDRAAAFAAIATAHATLAQAKRQEAQR
jgi:hypothetical protein